MDNKGIFAQLAAIPILAIFLGVGVLAIRIALDWTQQTTQTLIGGLLVLCGAAIMPVSILLGLAIFKRLNRDREQPAPPPQAIRMLGGYPVSPYSEPGSPMLTDGSEKLGSWSSNGPASYDVWEEEPAWREGGRR
jgi:hypothetical protein